MFVSWFALILNVAADNHYSGQPTQPTEPACCINKTVGGLLYSLTSQDDNSAFDCLNSCRYAREDEEGENRYCFAAGTLKEECHDRGTEPVTGTNKPLTEQPAPGTTGMQDSFLLVGGQTSQGVTPYSEFIGLPSISASDFPLPEKAYLLFSVVTPTQAMLCSWEKDKTCYTFHTSTNQWKNSSQFKLQRKYSSVVTLASGPYVLGGENGPKTSEVWRNGVWIDGPAIPMHVVLSCATAYNSFTLVIIGGNWDKTPVWSYNEDMGQWKQWPSLPGPRWDSACLKLSDGPILVAGGSAPNPNQEPGQNVLSSALKINETHITEAGNMIRSRVGPRMVYMSGKINVIGGIPYWNTSRGDPLTSIEEYNQEKDVWTISDMELNVGRRSYTLIPAFLLFGCPAGWKKYETKCYKRFEEPLIWEQAERACQICEGHLASINSKEENTFIITLGLEGSPYIGGFKTKDGDWGWIDGSTWNYTNWQQQPKQPSGDGNYMNLFANGWNDLNSYHNIPYVCESFLGKKSQNCENLV